MNVANPQSPVVECGGVMPYPLGILRKLTVDLVCTKLCYVLQFNLVYLVYCALVFLCYSVVYYGGGR